MDSTVYECRNTACPLGSRQQPGQFTGGASKELILTLTGDPKPEHYGEGVCPNCGKPGTKVEENFAPAVGEDPLQPLHDEIAKRNLPKQLDAMSPTVEYSMEDFREEVATDMDEVIAAAEEQGIGHDEDEEDDDDA